MICLFTWIFIKKKNYKFDTLSDLVLPSSIFEVSFQISIKQICQCSIVYYILFSLVFWISVINYSNFDCIYDLHIQVNLNTVSLI